MYDKPCNMAYPVFILYLWHILYLSCIYGISCIYPAFMAYPALMTYPVFPSHSNDVRLGLWVQRVGGTLILFILGFVAPGIPKVGTRELLNVGDPVFQSEEGQVCQQLLKKWSFISDLSLLVSIENIKIRDKQTFYVRNYYHLY